jgi:hypothetical protein
VTFALRFIKATVADLTSSNFDREMKNVNRVKMPWLITFCGDGGGTASCSQLLACQFHSRVTDTFGVNSMFWVP